MKKLDFESLKYYTGDEKPFQVLSQDGEVVDKDLMPDLTDEQLVDLFKEMIWSRVVGDRSTKLNRQGRLGFIAPTQGQEASEMASNYAMEKDDFLAGAYRDIPQLVKHGLPLAQAFMWSKGHYNGTKFPEELKALPPQIIIGAQYAQTAGIALGLKKKGTKNVAYSYTGDGGTSQGDFYEGINFAGAFHAPAVFIVQNNGYGISVPRAKQTAAPTLAQKGVAAGLPCFQVDGMDALAVYATVKQARDYAAEGNGPVLIETLTYRYGAHTLSGDDPSRYRSSDEEAEWHAKDPIERMRNFLTKKGLWTEEQENTYVDEVNAEVDAAVKELESQPAQTVSEMLKFEFVDAPATIQKQIKKYEEKEAK